MTKLVAYRCNPRNWIEDLVAVASGGLIVHTELLLDDGRRTSAHYAGGVYLLPAGLPNPDHADREEIDLPWRENGDFCAFVQAQVGLPYDAAGALLSALCRGRGIMRPGRWWCSEHSAAAIMRLSGAPQGLPPAADPADLVAALLNMLHPHSLRADWSRPTVDPQRLLAALDCTVESRDRVETLAGPAVRGGCFPDAEIVPGERRGGLCREAPMNLPAMVTLLRAVHASIDRAERLLGVNVAEARASVQESLLLVNRASLSFDLPSATPLERKSA